MIPSVSSRYFCMKLKTESWLSSCKRLNMPKCANNSQIEFEFWKFSHNFLHVLQVVHNILWAIVLVSREFLTNGSENFKTWNSTKWTFFHKKDHCGDAVCSCGNGRQVEIVVKSFGRGLEFPMTRKIGDFLVRLVFWKCNGYFQNFILVIRSMMYFPLDGSRVSKENSRLKVFWGFSGL